MAWDTWLTAQAPERRERGSGTACVFTKGPALLTAISGKGQSVVC